LNVHGGEYTAGELPALSAVGLAVVLAALVRALLCLGVDAGPAHLPLYADGLRLSFRLRH
jgi:hypothetical protein